VLLDGGILRVVADGERLNDLKRVDMDVRGERCSGRGRLYRL